MNKENCALKLVDEITLYYDARSKKNIRLYNAVVYTDGKTMHYVTFSRMNTKSAISPDKSFLSCFRHKQSGSYLRLSHLSGKDKPRLF